MKKTLMGSNLYRLVKFFRIMRIITFLLVLSLVHSYAAPSYGQSSAKLNLKVERSTIEAILGQIEQETDFHFFYQSEDLKKDKTFDVDVKNSTVFEILDMVLPKAGLSYEVFDKYIAISSSEKNAFASMAKPQTVKGKVTDFSGGPLPGVTVFVKGTATGIVTDVEGNYSLANVPDDATLVFSFVGMKSQEIAVSGKTSINVVMQEETVGIEEVVAIGYGNMKKNKVSTSIASVSTQEIRKQVTNSIENALQGQTAGVFIKQLSGAPGGGSSIKIRGSGSIGAGGRPLVIVDGMPMTGCDSEQSPFSFINMDDVESIDILKGVAAAAIYGSRGANGCILIKTKAASEGRTDLSVSIKTGIDQILPREELDLMNAEQYARWQNENAYERAAYYGYEITSDNIDTYIPEVYRNPEALRGKSVNWFNYITRIAPRQEFDVNVTHGTKNFKGFFSAGYTKTDGTIKNTDFERFSLRANMSYEPNKYIAFGLSMNPTMRKWNGKTGKLREGGWGSVFMATPIDGPYDDKGIWERYDTDYWDGKWDLDIQAGNSFSNGNPLYTLKNTVDITKNFDLLAQPYLEVNPLKGLKIRTQYRMNLSYSTVQYFRPSTVSGIYNPPPTAASGYYDTSRGYTWGWESLATYTKSLGDHNFSVLAGYTREHSNSYSSDLSGSGYPADDIETLNVTTSQTGSTTESNWSMISYIARLTYDYQSKYLLTATYRRDGSSRFGSESKWGNFPSVSVGWNVNKEKFFPQTEWLSNMKIRASYGLSGNNNIGNYASVPTISDGTYSFGGTIVNTKYLSSMGNSMLTWEKSNEFDTGLDLTLFKNKLEFIFDYYKRTTKDMLWGVSIPRSSGFSSISSNVGKIENKGVEFALNATLLSTNNIRWKASANIAFNHNEVVDLGSDVAYIHAGYCTTEPGHPIGMYYLWKTDGIIDTWEEYNDPGTGIRAGQGGPGVRKFVDQNGDRIIDSSDKVICGNPHPTFTGGFSTSLNYKNWDMSISGSYACDYDILAQLEADILNLDGVFNSSVEAEERWRSAGEPGNGRIPNTFYRTTDFRTMASSNIYTGIYYIKFNNITLGYNFKNILKKPFRIYGALQNPFIITNYKYGNPDTCYDGDNSLAGNIDRYDYPLTRSFIIGLNINL